MSAEQPYGTMPRNWRYWNKAANKCDWANHDIVMTPTKKVKGKCLTIERKKKNLVRDEDAHFKAAGKNAGMVVNKEISDANGDVDGNPHLQLEFRCFLINKKNGDRIVEQRKLRFWFVEGTDHFGRMNAAYDFFRQLVHPDTFPRDYVGFVMNTMKQMKDPRYKPIRKVDVELVPLDISDAPPPSPVAGEGVVRETLPLGLNCGRPFEVSNEVPGLPKQDNRTHEEIVREQLLLTLESAYPNILAMDDLVKILDTDEKTISAQLRELQDRELVRMEVGGFMRQVEDKKTEVKAVKQFNTATTGQRPTIAIITAMYHEKMAVDAMMRDKTTFVKYKKEGESNLYTIGSIGNHKVISTKLPMLGRQRTAQISSGNTTTRLLGTFLDVETVLLVGTCGGIPHMTDYNKHPRLGDVIVSKPNDGGPMYVFCDRYRKTDEGISYKTRDWTPKSLALQNIADRLREQFETNPTECIWQHYIEEGLAELTEQEASYVRPNAASDRLFMSIGGHEVIEIGHPTCPEGTPDFRISGVPCLRSGPMGAGRDILKDDTLRQDFSQRFGLAAYNTEMDQVLESIVGNCKDDFMFIQGVADYTEGHKNKEWQPYAALSAAAVMRAIIEEYPNPNVDL
ncbi:uncharacterized protein LOC135497910 isoform X3 [Lineus longissimus]|uniref:uncharacterized protein LOC135497910 isoform X3 n=1 Tax=Lineus longissimus TaxID=88925 RepID=UPI00315CFC65